jgi:hypothetical protein
LIWHDVSEDKVGLNSVLFSAFCPQAVKQNAIATADVNPSILFAILTVLIFMLTPFRIQKNFSFALA